MTTFTVDEGGWGDVINWRDIARRRVVGWKDVKPVKGDILRSKMQSGKIGLFRFTKIDPCRDPHDMFFADVKFVGYEGEEPPPARFFRWPKKETS